MYCDIGNMECGSLCDSPKCLPTLYNTCNYNISKFKSGKTIFFQMLCECNFYSFIKMITFYNQHSLLGALPWQVHSTLIPHYIGVLQFTQHSINSHVDFYGGRKTSCNKFILKVQYRDIQCRTCTLENL
jgi:hypothetical protein